MDGTQSAAWALAAVACDYASAGLALGGDVAELNGAR